eukprot:Colp12_sorted_trinity150504_noHs@24857
MADTAHKDPEQIKERYDTSEELELKLDVLADLLRNARHAITFTGAGISTSAGIPDFRGPTGVWTMRAQGKEAPKGVGIAKAIPTYTHMAIVEMLNAGKLGYVVSQNCDGLHRKSGVRKDQISELHGNTNKEICKKCKREYLRDFKVRNAKKVHEHGTGRFCDDPSCKGPLLDTIINFGEDLPDEPLALAFAHAKAADLCLVLGSSCTVTPAADVPYTLAKRRQKLVIVNLQNTPLDEYATLRIFAKTDIVMQGLLQRLGLQAPPPLFQKKIRITSTAQSITVQGLNTDDNTPFSFLSKVEFSDGEKSIIIAKEPYKIEKKLFQPTSKTTVGDLGTPREICVTLQFMRHYGEPDLAIKHPRDGAVTMVHVITYDPSNRVWCDVSSEKVDVVTSSAPAVKVETRAAYAARTNGKPRITA